MSGVRVAVVGGSIGGCAAALAVHRAGYGDIVVHERAAGDLAERGVGIAVHSERYTELESAGYLDAAMPCVRISERRWYVRDGADPLGRVIRGETFPFRAYNWGSLWRELRGRVPDSVEFRSGTTVESVVESAAGAEVRTAGPAGAGVPSGSDRYDLVIGADGYRSVVRNTVCPDVRPAYAGYLAWRGAYPESRLADPGRWEKTVTAYVAFDGGHAVIYRIPDAQGGHRVNWVLYTAPPPGLDISLDMPTSLPPGTLSDALHRHLTELAGDRLPPFWAALVGLTGPDELFVQPMYDFTASPGVTSRLALVGDAATVARPHTGAGAVKALQDATLLESALTAAPDLREGLRAYESSRAAMGRTMVELGRRLGHALVEATPDWQSLDGPALDAWWQRADAAGAFGGKKLRK
ncbi:FAD binding domain-containing protein [Streptomyces jumonjinensis]|uniref:FAD binding domain-containing protein n=1 Tax=Streptomyces jumonjinensis TaxID=1945 RepID=UPI003791DD40